MSLPVPNLDDKNFNELFEQARSLITGYAPDWTDHNFSDPGITLIDLFAWLAEMQRYRLNRIDDENKLKFLKLLGESPYTTVPATLDVSFSIAERDRRSVFIQSGTQVATTNPKTGEDIVFETNEDITVYNMQITSVYTYDQSGWRDNTETNNTTDAFYFPFGRIPGLETRLFLGFKSVGAFPTGEIKASITVYKNAQERESIPAAVAQTMGAAKNFPSATLAWQYWNGSSWEYLAVTDGTNALTRSGLIAFLGRENIGLGRIEEIEKDIALQRPSTPLYWLRVLVKEPGYEIPPRLDSILLNTISATQAKTILEEELTTRSLPRQTVALAGSPILHDTLELELLEDDGKNHRWHRVADFDASGPNDRHYTVDLQEGVIHFGDGIRGRIPTGENAVEVKMKALRYRVTNGEEGNVLAKTIDRILDPTVNGVTVENRRPASGGMASETIERALHRVRQDLKKPSRTITSEDFEKLVRAIPGLPIARVGVFPLYHPDYPGLRMPGAVTVIVVPNTLSLGESEPPVPSEGFLKTVRSFLETRRVITTNLHVRGPKFVRTNVSAKIQIDPHSNSAQVIEAAKARLTQLLNPVNGGPDAAGWAFGRSVFKSEIYQVLDAVEGINCVDSVSLAPSGGCGLLQGENLVIPKIGLVYSGTHTITIGASDGLRHARGRF